ncbi:MAG: sulfotransferase [Pirellulaceae bacterium]|nr:sulfotransferase [Pirellulaceae bacterium]
MSTWRERFLIRYGPGVLAGITLGDWLTLLRENRFSVDPAYLPRAAAVSFATVINSFFRCYEEWRYGAKWRDVPVPPPLFVLGHWRSGTTHLHYLLGLDDRFACPNLYQVHYPHTFLSTERWFSGLTAFLLPRHRPYDNVRLDLTVPDEDEFAMCVSGFMSCYLAGVFPRRAEHYDQFLTFRNAPPQAIEIWKSSLLRFLQKLTFKYDKPLIIKSPTHTGRIKLLLEIFPGARFVHIHRDPYTVFQSTVHTHRAGLPFARLQRTDQFDWTERIVRQYKEVHDAFFEERSLIPAGHLYEVCFEDLEQDPAYELRKIYAALNLPEFEQVEPKIGNYMHSLSDYRKNRFPELAPEMRKRIAGEWRRCFEEWGYSP